jgi:hypothetical protein
MLPISNVEVVEEQGDEGVVSSTFPICQIRRATYSERYFVDRDEHYLRRVDGAWCVASKKSMIATQRFTGIVQGMLPVRLALVAVMNQCRLVHFPFGRVLKPFAEAKNEPKPAGITRPWSSSSLFSS